MARARTVNRPAEVLQWMASDCDGGMSTRARRSRIVEPTRLSMPLKYQHILFWGGLRGALALALALTIPNSVPEKVAIIITAFVVVAFSIFVQGLSMPWLVKKLGVSQGKAAASQEVEA